MMIVIFNRSQPGMLIPHGGGGHADRLWSTLEKSFVFIVISLEIYRNISKLSQHKSLKRD